MRDESNWANTEHLQELADTVQIEKQPVTILVAMGTRWRRLGGNPQSYLRRVHHQYPGDFWLNFELGLLNDAMHHQMSELAAALAHNLAALAVRPMRPPSISIVVSLMSVWINSTKLHTISRVSYSSILRTLGPHIAWLLSALMQE